MFYNPRLQRHWRIGLIVLWYTFLFFIAPGLVSQIKLQTSSSIFNFEEKYFDYLHKFCLIGRLIHLSAIYQPIKTIQSTPIIKNLPFLKKIQSQVYITFVGFLFLDNLSRQGKQTWINMQKSKLDSITFDKQSSIITIKPT